MSATRKIIENVKDAFVFGPNFLLRHVSTLRRRPFHRAKVRGIGRIHFRPGTGDVKAFRDIFRDRQYDLSRTKHGALLKQAYRDLLKRGVVPLIIDVGANIGAASLWFSREFPLAEIIAVEPDNDKATIFRHNLASRERVTLMEAAIGNRTGLISSNTSLADSVAITTERVLSSRSVLVTTIPSLLDGAGQDRELFIVKIDIEGFEKDLFADNVGWVDLPRAIFIEPHDHLFPGCGTSYNFQQVMAQSRHDLLIVDETLIYFRADQATSRAAQTWTIH
jgi:FkbM family methyltransferase